MDIYNLTKVDTTMDGKRGVLLQGFNIIGAHGRPLVTLSFETLGGGRSSAESNAACCQNGKADHTSHPVRAAEKVERPGRNSPGASPPTSPSCLTCWSARSAKLTQGVAKPTVTDLPHVSAK